MPRNSHNTQSSIDMLLKYFRKSAMEPIVIVTMSNPNDEYFDTEEIVVAHTKTRARLCVQLFKHPNKVINRAPKNFKIQKRGWE